MIDAIAATLLTLGSDIQVTIQFYREYFVLRNTIKEHR